MPIGTTKTSIAIALALQNIKSYAELSLIFTNFNNLHQGIPRRDLHNLLLGKILQALVLCPLLYFSKLNSNSIHENYRYTRYLKHFLAMDMKLYYTWLIWVRGGRGIWDTFDSLTSCNSEEWFSRNSSTRVSIGIARSDSIVPLLGISGSHLIGVLPVGS